MMTSTSCFVTPLPTSTRTKVAFFLLPTTSIPNAFAARPHHQQRFLLGCNKQREFFRGGAARPPSSSRLVVVRGMLPVDPWAPGGVNSQSIASQLFAFSLFPYLGFLYFITKSNSAPKLTLFGFYFLLAFVGATIPAGIYAKVQYGTSLSNVDWLHGGAESLLTLTNLFIVLGLREALRKTKDAKKKTAEIVSGMEEKEQSSV